jgi:hypothetical protein
MRKFPPLPLIKQFFQFLNTQQVLYKMRQFFIFLKPSSIQLHYCKVTMVAASTKGKPAMQQGGSASAPGIGASTPQSRPVNIAMRSWMACTAAAEYCG